MEAAEKAAYRARYGKFHPSLYERLQEVKDDDLLPVALWMAPNAQVRTREQVYAELAAQYAEAAVALEREGTPWAVDDPDLATEIRQEYRRMRAEDTALRVGPLVDGLTRGGFELKIYGAMPSVTAFLPKKEIVELAERDDVGLIYLIEEQGSDVMDTAAPTDRVPAVWQRGFDGSGVRIAILENNNVDDDIDCLDIVATRPGLPRDEDDHAAMVASIAACDDDTYTGVAPGAQIIDARYDGTAWPGGSSQEDAVEALKWAIQDEDADVVNVSQKWEYDENLNWIDRAFDYWVREERVVIVSAAANGGPGADNEGWSLGSPAKGWNVISVGGSDDNQTAAWSDDGMYADSSYVNPVGTHREKPEVVAPAVHIDTIGLGGSSDFGTGTSFAAPQVTGLAALLINRRITLSIWPPAVKAIIMASAVHNVHGPSDIPTGQDLRDGAGAIDAALADEIAKKRSYSDTTPCDAPCWWGIYTSDSDPKVEHSLYRYFNASRGERIRVAISWWSNPDPPLDHPNLADDVLDTNYNLLVYAPSGALVAYSASRDNNYELVDFVAQETGEYEIRVHRSSLGDNNESSNQLGIVWVKDATYLPDIKSSYNSWDSEIIIRNDGAQSRDVKVTLFNADGSNAGEATYYELGANAVWVYNPSHTNFTGSAIVSGGEDVSAAVSNTKSSNGQTYSFSGIGDALNPGWGQVGATIHLPLLMDNNYGSSTLVTILNAGSATASIDLDYYDQGTGGSWQGPTGSLAPGASVTYGQAGSSCPTAGAGRITSSQPLAVIVQQYHSSGSSAGYNGFGSGATTIDLPLIMANNYGWFTGIAVQNLGTVNTLVRVYYDAQPGYPARSSESATVGPHRTVIFVQSGGQWGSGLWVGSARVSASQPLAAIVNQTASGKLASYSSFLDGTSYVVLPDVRNNASGWTSGVQVQNLDSSTADVVLKVNGSQTWSGSIGAYQSKTWYPVPGTSSGFQGAVEVQCTNGRRIAAIVNAAASGSGDYSRCYNGFDR